MIKLQKGLFKGNGRLTQYFGSNASAYARFGLKGKDILVKFLGLVRCYRKGLTHFIVRYKPHFMGGFINKTYTKKIIYLFFSVFIKYKPTRLLTNVNRFTSFKLPLIQRTYLNIYFFSIPQQVIAFIKPLPFGFKKFSNKFFPNSTPTCFCIFPIFAINKVTSLFRSEVSYIVGSLVTNIRTVYNLPRHARIIKGFSFNYFITKGTIFNHNHIIPQGVVL